MGAVPLEAWRSEEVEIQGLPLFLLEACHVTEDTLTAVTLQHGSWAGLEGEGGLAARSAAFTGIPKARIGNVCLTHVLCIAFVVLCWSR